ncbi:hypothetical protein [Brevundimonas sp.]|uniref:hypothetical protein n=1 Tax=Brevundimonas sp. TaxID=1871086 RepID=UPI001A35A52E|nr:hypothetical protein [Brevundimonas sp.]MBJ7484371.1 hypothetical protein [Brevundimonas sp.]
MKRANLLSSMGLWIGAAVALLVLSACTAPARAPQSSSSGPAAWVMTPQVEGAERRNGGLMLVGQAAPDGRVVVRGPGGVAYATSADATGHFALRIDIPGEAALFVVETQSGQEATPAPYRLLVSPDAEGPVALLTTGGPSVRLDSAGPLAVIDGDGQTVLASGRAQPGAMTAVSTGGASIERQAQADGRWVLPLTQGASELTVGGRRYVVPSLSVGEQGALSVRRGAGGRLVSWTTPGGAVQASWFPDRA